MMKCCALALASLASTCAVGCGGKIDPASVETNLYATECAHAPTPPDTLECTGLYANLKTKKLAKGVMAFAPAIALWSDGADKLRYIQLPEGKTIDATDPNEWKFPVGTKVWKEFSRNGKRAETRLWQKAKTDYWVRATYRWNDDDTEATVSGAADIPWSDGRIYHIPSGDECDQCHRGRTERILGFEQGLLGLSGATGLTLEQLVADKLISPPPKLTKLSIGDDGTGMAAGPLGWLHANCGVSCHNGNSSSTAYGASQRLRLDPTLLDGRSSADFETITTTVNIMADTPDWLGQTRIVPGKPQDSLLVKLITNRGTNNPVMNQMPPIASLIIDPPDTQAVIDWIQKMPSQ